MGACDFLKRADKVRCEQLTEKNRRLRENCECTCVNNYNSFQALVPDRIRLLRRGLRPAFVMLEGFPESVPYLLVRVKQPPLINRCLRESRNRVLPLFENFPFRSGNAIETHFEVPLLSIV